MNRRWRISHFVESVSVKPENVSRRRRLSSSFRDFICWLSANTNWNAAQHKRQCVPLLCYAIYSHPVKPRSTISPLGQQDVIHVLTNKTMFGHNAQQHVWRKPNTSYQLSSTVVEGWWSGLVLQPQDLGTLQSLSPPWTPLDTKVF